MQVRKIGFEENLCLEKWQREVSYQLINSDSFELKIMGLSNLNSKKTSIGKI